MGKVRVAAFGVSLDGFGAGPNQSLENPLGERGPEIMNWVFPTQFFQKIHGAVDANTDVSATLPRAASGSGVDAEASVPSRPSNGTTGIDNDFAMRSFENVGAWILGRNMFGPIRGPWVNDDWKGWWGENPPYHVPIFVLTHHKREPLRMAGDNTFHFVTDGIESALKQAKAAAGDKDVRIGGGVATVRQYLQKGLIDEMHLAFSPVLLGKGENLLQGLDLPALGFTKIEHTMGEAALHVLAKKE